MAFEFTDANFQEKALDHKGVTVIDFWAEWCGPCKMLGPIVEDLANDYGENVLIGKMDVDSNSEVPLKFGVRSIPTVVILKDGQLVDKHIGLTTKVHLQQKIDTALNVAAA